MRSGYAVLVVSIVLLGLAVGASGQNPPPAPPSAAPPAGSPAIYKPNQGLMEALQKAVPNAAGMFNSPVSNTDQFRINVIRRDKAAGALAHPGNTELHYIIDGAATLVTGGTIVRAGGATAATIDNGVERRVAKGDIAIVPANTPHWYREVEGSVTYLEVRWLAPKN